MKKIICSVLIIGFAFSCVNSDKKNDSNIQTEYDDSYDPYKNSYTGPPMFVLTEMNGRELEEEAYFTINYDNTFELKIGDGTIFKYVATNHFGDEPLCNILAKDDRGLQTAICIRKQTGTNVLVMLENNEMKSNFKGYKK